MEDFARKGWWPIKVNICQGMTVMFMLIRLFIVVHLDKMMDTMTSICQKCENMIYFVAFEVCRQTIQATRTEK